MSTKHFIVSKLLLIKL